MQQQVVDIDELQALGASLNKGPKVGRAESVGI